jgi:hypothetical protein
MNIEEIYSFIQKLTWNEVRELRNFCNRVMRIKYKKIREKHERRIFQKERTRYLT